MTMATNVMTSRPAARPLGSCTTAPTIRLATLQLSLDDKVLIHDIEES